VLRQVGWDAATLEGGYRAYRREVITQLDRMPQGFRFQVVCGATGSGKSRLLAALAEQGAQVLDLERLARHRGSLLGELPGEPQPSQKMFDSLVWCALKRLDPARPVFVEAESKKIGQLQVPAQLLARMREGECLRIEVPLPERVRFLIEEYRHFLEKPVALKERLQCLTSRYGRAVIERWLAQTDSGAWDELVADLLVTHYDPSYLRAAAQNYLHYDEAQALSLARLDQTGMAHAAGELLKAEP
jgi:tRNA 2-selenouridine synthase